MIVHRNGLHASQVDAWEAKNGQSVSAKELPFLYAKAIQAIEQRSLSTLSRITMQVIVDRALHEATEKFPALSDVKAGSEALDFTDFLNKSDLTPEELKLPLRELLIDLLNVLGNITADILTTPLHRELMDVSNDRPLTKALSQTLRAMNSVKKNREQT
jgi:hypothetical protein